jgi:hypothetical protein
MWVHNCNKTICADGHFFNRLNCEQKLTAGVDYVGMTCRDENNSIASKKTVAPIGLDSGIDHHRRRRFFASGFSEKCGRLVAR